MKGKERIRQNQTDRETNKPLDVYKPVEKDYTEDGEAKLKVLASTNETPQSRKRKRINEQVMDHQTEYNKKMKLSRKKQRSFKGDDYVTIKIDKVDKTTPRHPNTILGKIIALRKR